MSDKSRRIGIIGLGYVGLPLAVELARHYPVVGFDLNEKKVQSLRQGLDLNGEISEAALKKAPIKYTTDPAGLKKCNFVIVAVPTPITKDKKPDLTPVESASELVGANLSAGTVVVFESTVYPGVIEEICVPIIERASGLKCGRDWKIGYSPERVNPGDREHTIDKITKVISGMDADTLAAVAEVYGSFTAVHRAPNIKTAEAAKVIENIQRDLNIALMNELSLIFEKMGIRTKDVLAAASTKWNFHAYRPGLVGGHCIGVDPYYLTYRAQELGYEPQVILAGRTLNDSMPVIVAQRVVAALSASGVTQPRIQVMGLTFKENVKDSRNSKARELIRELKKNQASVTGWDPFLDDRVVKGEFGVNNQHPLEAEPFDALIVLAPHRQFNDISIKSLSEKMPGGVLFDLTELYPIREAEALGLRYLTL